MNKKEVLSVIVLILAITIISATFLFTYMKPKLGGTLTEVPKYVEDHSTKIYYHGYNPNPISEDEYNNIIKTMTPPDFVYYNYPYILNTLKDNEYYKTGAVDVGSTTAEVLIKYPSQTEKVIYDNEK